MSDPATVTEAELAEALKAYSALGMSPTGFAKALFRDVRIAAGATADPDPGTDPSQVSPSAVAGSREQSAASWRERAEAAEARLLELENAITWGTSCLSCSAILDRANAERERAEHAEGKLATLAAHCHANAYGNTNMQEVMVSAGNILAITGTEKKGDERNG